MDDFDQPSGKAQFKRNQVSMKRILCRFFYPFVLATVSMCILCSCSNEYEETKQWNSPNGQFRLQATHCETSRGHAPLNYIVLDLLTLPKKKVICHLAHDIPYGIASYRGNERIIWSADSQMVEAIFKHSDFPEISFSYNMKSGQLSFKLPDKIKEGFDLRERSKGVTLHERDAERLRYP